MRHYLQLNKSIVIAIIFSYTAITVDNAANAINIKNNTSHITPPGIWLNTLGSVMNNNDGPAPGYNVLSGVQPLGAGTTIMDLEDFIVSYNILPLAVFYSCFSVQERTAGDMTISWQKLIWEKAYHFLNG